MIFECKFKGATARALITFSSIFFREYYDNFLVEPVMEELLLHQLLL